MTAAATEPSQDELRAYVRRSLVNTAVGLVALLLVLGGIGVVYERELIAAATWVAAQLGIPGLGALVFVADALLSPLPPDVVLVVISKTLLASDWAWLVPLGGLVSAIAGCVGWLIGRALAVRGRGLPRWLSNERLNRALVARYGRWAVVLGALTPIPFSVTCWLAGVCRMPFGSFAPITLLRIPRFVVYYLLIAGAGDLVSTLF